MEKEIYEAPKCEVLNIESESMICTSPIQEGIDDESDLDAG